MATYRFECDSKPTRNKKHNIYLMVTVDGKRRKSKTGIAVDRMSDFNTKCKGNNWVRASVPDSKAWNEELAGILERARAKYNELASEGKASPENVATKTMHQDKPKSFIEFCDERLQEIYNDGMLASWKTNGVFINKLKDYLKSINKSDLLFAEIDTVFLTKFQNYLNTLTNSRTKNVEPTKLHPTTINKLMRIFRAYINRGISLNYLGIEKNPFKFYKMPKRKEPNKEPLTAQEISKLETKELIEGSLKWHARNMFLFSFYCAGIRAGDLLQLRWKDVEGGRLHYRMDKNGKDENLILVSQAVAILELYKSDDLKENDFVFPLLSTSSKNAYILANLNKDTMTSHDKQRLLEMIGSKNALLNKNLSKVAEDVGITKKISMHIARHTFSAISQEMGVSPSKLQHILRHYSLTTTIQYMKKFDTTQDDATMLKIFGDTQVAIKNEIVSMLDGLDEEQLAKVLETVKAIKESK